MSGLKEAFRNLRHSPGYTVLALGTIAVAVGINTAIFAIADALLFRPLPYSEPDRLFFVRAVNRQTGTTYSTVSGSEIGRLMDVGLIVGGPAVVEPRPPVVVATNAGPETMSHAAVSAHYFNVLGVIPTRGRTFTVDDVGGPANPALLSYAAWQQRFGADEGIVGRSIAAGPHVLDVVGVLPAGFVFTNPAAGRPELVTAMLPSLMEASSGLTYPVVRLRPGTTVEQVNATLAALSASADGTGSAPAVPVLAEIKPVLYATGRRVMPLFLGAAGLVILLACVNVASLFRLRAHRAQHDIAVRVALGAERRHLLRPHVIEAVLIGLASAGLAFTVVRLAFDSLLAHLPSVLLQNAEFSVDDRVLTFALALGTVAGVSFSVLPTWLSLRRTPTALTERTQELTAGTRLGLGNGVVFLQVALTMTLVIGALIVARSFLEAVRQPLGFHPQNVVRISVQPEGLRGHALQAFYARVLESVRSRGDVLYAGAVGSMPLDGTAPDEGVRLGEGDGARIGATHVLPGYFETAGIPLVRGRLLRADDLRTGTNAVVVNESAARIMSTGGAPPGTMLQTMAGRQLNVVGIVADATTQLGQPAAPLAYIIPGESTRRLSLLVRTRHRQESLLRDLRREVAAFAPQAAVTAAWWSDLVAALTAYRDPRFQTFVFGTFATVGLVITALGVFVLIGYLGYLRTREFGVRLALGGTRGSLLMLLMRSALMPTAAGILMGALGTMWLGSLLESRLPRVDARDPVVFSIAAAVVLLAAGIAAALPACRASRVNPAVLLRSE